MPAASPSDPATTFLAIEIGGTKLQVCAGRGDGDIIDRRLHHAAIAATLAQRYAAGTRDSPAYTAALAKRNSPLMASPIRV